MGYDIFVAEFVSCNSRSNKPSKMNHCFEDLSDKLKVDFYHPQIET